MIQILSEAEGALPQEYAANMSDAEIRAKFYRLVKRETRSLEKDLIEVIS